MKEINTYLQVDKAGHLERSGTPLKLHMDRSSGISPQERLNYFYGMTTMFPLIFLGNYYQWLTDGKGKDYHSEFLPAMEQAYGPYNRSLLERIYEAPDSFDAWLSSLSSYLSCYPHLLLAEFTRWAFPAEQAQKVNAFLAAERKEQLIPLLDRLTLCRDDDVRIQTVFWLGTEYPYQLLSRFHNSLFGI